MALFGEIVEPTTRTAWEDWDEIESSRAEIETRQLNWLNQTEDINSVETFFLFEGKYLSDCVKGQKDFELQLINSVPTVNLNLYKEKETNRYICTVKDYNIVLSSEIVELLKPYISVSVNFIAILTKPLQIYQTSAPVQDCIIRTVSSSKPVPVGLQYPKLEQPNIISGVAAGAVFLRENLNLSGSAFVCYMEYPEDYDMDALHQLLGKLNINVRGKPSNILNSNLYI